MNVLDKDKLLDFMGKRKAVLYDQLVRDWTGELQSRIYEHREVKFWKEAIERGEFNTELSEIYVILSATHPEIADFTFYDDEESVKKRVYELNKIAKREEYWWIRLYSNVRNNRD